MDQLYVFLSSPGDVEHERQLAREVLEQLESEQSYCNRLKLEAVAWDKPGSGTPMPAHLEPQEAIDQELRRPSQCEIVVVIMWSRMGTPLSANHRKPDGSRYRSGTEYEFLDALSAARKNGRPTVLVYRRTEEIQVGSRDPDRDEKLKQWDQVETFFKEFRNPDGSFQSFYKKYEKPHDFREELERDLRHLIERHFAAAPSTASRLPKKGRAPAWDADKSPFPGLRRFMPDEAPIFFGRERQKDQLLELLNEPGRRIIIVVGSSGSGKSSLVSAGLLPALEKGAVPGSRDWICLRFAPADMNDNPFDALAAAFKPILEKRGLQPRQMAGALVDDAAAAADFFTMALDGRPHWAELLLFIDQFEEFFRLVDEKYRQRFVELLALAAETPRVRVVATMRSDFYHHCLDWPVLNNLVVEGHFALLPPEPGALYEMITRPARRAGLQFKDGLENRILSDTGTQPGALALMAFALRELWKMSQGSGGLLTHAAYDSFDGVHGAIGKRAEDTFSNLAGEKAVLEKTLADVFRELVEVDEQGTPTRRRAGRRRMAADPIAAALVDQLADARLLVTGKGEDNAPTVEVAHEAIFTHWPRYDAWISQYGDSLYLRRQVRRAAAAWEKDVRKSKYLWSDERVMDVAAMMDQLNLGTGDFSPVERAFLGPVDIEDMLAQIGDPGTSHQLRAVIGRRLSLLGEPRLGTGLRDDGLPDISWCQVPGGEVKLEIKKKSGWLNRLIGKMSRNTFHVDPFYIAKYPVTWMQYGAFLEAEDGYKNEVLWHGLAYKFDKPDRQFNPFDNHPAENVTWIEVVVFCRWLAIKLGYEILLPTEYQWQQAATGGDTANTYPWGPDWDAARANTYESELNCTTAVGMYPQGASPVDALDMSGNVWEWCLNEFDSPERIKVGGKLARVVRGGSWFNYRGSAGAAYRFRPYPSNRSAYVGFRLCCASPIL